MRSEPILRLNYITAGYRVPLLPSGPGGIRRAHLHSTRGPVSNLTRAIHQNRFNIFRKKRSNIFQVGVSFRFFVHPINS